jgi:hypothetical protein
MIFFEYYVLYIKFFLSLQINIIAKINIIYLYYDNTRKNISRTN